jgi:hypothetical protein
VLQLALRDAGIAGGVTARVAPFISLDQPLRKVPHMTDIGSRAPRRRPGYAWLAVGPVAAAGAIALFIACQPAVASTPPADLGSASGLAGLGNAGDLSGLGNAGGLSGVGNSGGLAGLNGTADTGAAPRHRHHGGDHCGCMSPATAPATMTPTPAQTTPAPTGTATTPAPTGTTPAPTPTPTPTGHRPPPAPVPVPVGNTFPVTG